MPEPFFCPPRTFCTPRRAAGIIRRDMPRPAPPVLEYLKPATTAYARVWRWSAVLLAALPVAAILSVHAVYAVEWVVNGEQPIPPHHGPNNLLESALYNVSGVLLLVFVPSLIPSLFLPAVAHTHYAKGVPPITFLPLASWVASAIILGIDPVGAMYFWAD